MKLKQRWQGFRRWFVAHKKPILAVLAGVTILSVAVQLVYPHGRAVPFASVAGQSVAFKTRPEITLMTQMRFTEARAKLVSGDKTVEQPLSNLGVRVDIDTMTEHATEYPWIFRAVPFSLVWYQPNLDRYALSFDDSRLNSVAQTFIEQLSEPAVNAGLEIKDGELAVTDAQTGQAVDLEKLTAAIKATTYNWDETIVTIPNQTVQPRVSDASVADVRQKAETVLAQEIIISIDNGQTFRPSRAEMASWLQMVTDDEGNITLAANGTTVEAYARDIASKTRDEPTVTVVTTVDGEETERNEGSPGRGVDAGALKNQLAQRVTEAQEGQPEIAVARREITPPIEYQRSYTSSQAGLSAYASELSENGDVQIAVRQLSRGGWSASGGGDKSVPSASTYKPLLMLRVLDDVQSRKLKWEDRIGSETLSECFERMIVQSANECAEELIERYSGRGLTDYLRGRGFSSGTGFTFSEATQTTANDLAEFMVGLETNKVMQKNHAQMMLEKMSRQIYRQGIPAGTSAPVFDKVGFLWEYKHDAAVVRHPEGSYVLVVMTKNKSWETIAGITRQVEKILYG